MKIIRLQLPGQFIENLGFKGLFAELEFIEILNAFQYEQNHFFSLQKIKFKPNSVSDIKKFIHTKFNPQFFSIMSKSQDEIVVIMSQKNPKGFFPIIQSGPWAFLFPLQASEDIVLVNIISQQEYVAKLKKVLRSITEDYMIIGISNVNEFNELSESLWRSAIPFPNFTTRQREIASYAAKHGYFNSPKKISAESLAQHFNLKSATINKHLRKAENLAMSYFFGF